MGYINPLLRLPAARALMALGAAERTALARVLLDLRAQANREAETAWARRKAPMACYWRAVSTYARHVAHALRIDRPADARQTAGAMRRGASGGRSVPPCIGDEAAMGVDDILALFEDLSLRGQATSLDDGLVGLGTWLAGHRGALSDDDFAALAAVGAAMHRACQHARSAPVAHLPAI